jgi:hypothetical protein
VTAERVHQYGTHVMRRKTTEVPHNQYLQRRRTWYVRVARFRPVVEDQGRAVARERRWEVLAEIRRWLRAPMVRTRHRPCLKDRDWWTGTDYRVRDPDTPTGVHPEVTSISSAYHDPPEPPGFCRTFRTRPPICSSAPEVAPRHGQANLY